MATIFIDFHVGPCTLFKFIAKNATAHKVNSYYTLAISYCTFCVAKHTVLGPVMKERHRADKLKYVSCVIMHGDGSYCIKTGLLVLVCVR